MKGQEFIKNLNVSELDCFDKIQSMHLESIQEGKGILFALLKLKKTAFLNKNISNKSILLDIGIEEKQYYYDNKSVFLKEITKLLDEYTNVLIPGDLYELFYFSEFKVKHHPSLFLVSGEDYNRFFIYDNHQILSGSTNQYENFYLLKDTLFLMNKKYMNYFEKISCITFAKIKDYNDDYNEIIKYLAPTEYIKLSAIYPNLLNQESIVEIVNKRLTILKILAFLTNIKLEELEGDFTTVKSAIILTLMKNSKEKLLLLLLSEFDELYMRNYEFLVNKLDSENLNVTNLINNKSIKTRKTDIHNFGSYLDTSIRRSFKIGESIKIILNNTMYTGEYFVGIEISISDTEDVHIGIGNMKLIYFVRNSKTYEIKKNYEPIELIREITITYKDNLSIQVGKHQYVFKLDEVLKSNLIFRNWTLTDVEFSSSGLINGNEWKC